jgi:hypothetical protein
MHEAVKWKGKKKLGVMEDFSRSAVAHLKTFFVLE